MQTFLANEVCAASPRPLSVIRENVAMYSILLKYLKIVTIHSTKFLDFYWSDVLFN